MVTALWWIRRDLRLSDNQALTAALHAAEQVVPVFVLDPRLWRSPYVGARRLAFLIGGLQALDMALHARGSALIVRAGEPATALAALIAETGAQAIYAEADVSPYARQRDARVAARLPLRLTAGVTVHPPGSILKRDGTPYTVFTPFSRAWLALPLPTAAELLPAPEHIPTPGGLSSVPWPDLPPPEPAFPPGESAAQRRLAAFTTSAIHHYAERRDRMAEEGTSRLSPYLRFGMLSARQAAVAALTARAAAATPPEAAGAATWLNELLWREFYAHILYHFPQVRRESFRPALRAVAWENDPHRFAAWCAGRTGYPIVDAGIRHLLATGWLHNRARMIVASFLTKDLLIDWRWGERFFMQQLLDGDPAANNGGWQWAAGTGTDAAPYFRIFNPVLQGEKFDPTGDYIRRWVPELARVPLPYLHRPWTMPESVQQAAGCRIGQDYPAPLVDHARARERALAVYKSPVRIDTL